MAEDLIASGSVEVADGYRLGPVNTTIWPLYRENGCVAYRYPAAEGDVFTLYQERGEYQIHYGALDADGVEIWRPDGYQTPARPYSKTFTMPAGTAYVVVSWQRSYISAVPTLVKVSGGGPTSVLSSAQVTLAWSAGIVATTRYYQLAASGSSAPSVPASSSSLGSWTASEPSADTSKDLWQCECTKLDDGTETWSAATKSSAYEAAKSVSADVTKLSDKVTATVSEQMKWNDSYASRTSSLEQRAAGFSASLDSMSSTDASIHQWMSFGQGTDGKPTLTIGTSDSDIVSRQTNSGLSYETRGGTELLGLDAASRSSTMPHVHADDVSMGNWQMGPTQNGTHFTLMYIGG